MQYEGGPTPTAIIIVWSNGITAVAYYWLTYQLIAFAFNSKVIEMTGTLRYNKDKAKRNLFYMLLAIAGLFALFISLCGHTHSFNVVRFFFPNSGGLQVAQLVMLVMCAIVSVVTAIIGSKLFPIILESLSDFELNSEGGLQHVENYLIEVVEMVKESIVVLSEHMKIVRCNEASKVLLNNPNLIEKTYTDFIHPSDLQIFQNAVTRVLGSYSMTPVTIEYRVNQKARALSPRGPRTSSIKAKGSAKSTNSRYSVSTQKVHIAPGSGHSEVELMAAALSPMVGAGSSSNDSPDSTIRPDTVANASAIDLDVFTRRGTETSVSIRAGLVNEEDYIWVESTMCKGMNLNQDDDFEYDIKLMSRNIEDRKRATLDQYNDILRENEERERTNAAKLRYISCIAHDLKTPLQSFCFTIDLLSQTHMHREQREYVQQANVAVDLMKLTISQTMDISKALTGAKLMPRRTTVYLSSVMSRVEIIINGYGKQVPVLFKLARNVCDRIITDEEWLWQMVLNLLTNACKYTDRGDIRVTVTKTRGSDVLGHQFKDEMLLVEVVDTGVGVSPDKMSTLFDAFSQVQAGQVTGTGLGLYGVRTRVEGLNGTCGARHNTESSTGSGTVLWFAIPYIPDEIASSSRNVSFMDEAFIETCVSPAYSPKRRQSSSMSVSMCAPDSPEPIPEVDLEEPEQRFELGNVEEQHASIAPTDLASRTEWLIRSRKISAMVIDDTKTVRKLMEKLLMKMGFESVVCYENGAKGLDAMMATPVDIVFSDVQMPIMTGPEMIRRFRLFEADAILCGAREKRQLVVAVTANGSELSESGNTGFDEVCPKPLSVQEIYHLVQKYFQLT